MNRRSVGNRDDRCTPHRSAAWVVTIVAAAGLPLLASCSAERHETKVATRQVRETVVTPLPPMTDISIVDLHDEPSGDAATEKVVGTIVNHGDKAVSQLSIRVDAMDSTGRVVSTVTTPPLAETIPANGGQADFSALMARNDAVTTYKAVAIAR
ncbi:MAG: FxLYD domain-containing protein [Candidatus Binatia bacterium]